MNLAHYHASAVSIIDLVIADDLKHPITNEPPNPKSQIRNPPSDIQPPKSQIPNPTSDIRHSTSDIRLPLPINPHNIRHLV